MDAGLHKHIPLHPQLPQLSSSQSSPGRMQAGRYLLTGQARQSSRAARITSVPNSTSKSTTRPRPYPQRPFDPPRTKSPSRQLPLQLTSATDTTSSATKRRKQIPELGGAPDDQTTTTAHHASGYAPSGRLRRRPVQGEKTFPNTLHLLQPFVAPRQRGQSFSRPLEPRR